MVVSQAQVDQSLREISVEKHKLENYNDELAKNVASTQALRAVKRQLERSNALLRARLNQTTEANANIKNHDVDQMYNEEIRKLKEYLEIIKSKKSTAEFELQQAKIDNREAKEEFAKTDVMVKQLNVVVFVVGVLG